MRLNQIRKLGLLAVILILCASLNSCGRAEQRVAIERQMTALTARSSGAFNGTWRVKLKASQDGCGLGLKGKTQPATVIIAQSGRKIRLTIRGLPKAFSGSANGNSASASGTYVDSGLTLNGSVSATKLGARQIRISSAILKIRGPKTNCRLVFAGSGTKA